MQNYFNGTKENNTALIELMKKYNMPYRVQDLGIPKTDEVFDMYYEKIGDESVIETKEEASRLKEALKYLWEVV